MTMSALYAQYEHYSINYPIELNDWSPTPVYPIYTVPMLVNPMLSAQIIPSYIAQTVVPIQSPVYTSNLSSTCYESANLDSPESPCLEDITTDQESVADKDPIEYYLSLPKDLFPTAKMLAIDPNWMIDECCKSPDIFKHTPWILDLELGIPKSPITRPIPYYNVKFNSIHCKNNPDAIHPGFESCTEDFKRVLLFYYDCVVSAWYKGYTIYNNDWSVENFQSWLLLPMQRFGMGWP